MRWHHRQTGFTLIELVMVIVLLSIIAVVISRLYVMGLNTALTAQNTTDALWQGNIAMERMVRDIRNTRSAADISTMTSSEYAFTTMSGTSIAYTLSSTTLMYNAQILADGINTLTFSYFDKNDVSTSSAANVNYVTINMTVTQNNVHYTLKSSVYLRDLSS